MSSATLEVELSKLTNVHELIVAGVSAVSAKPMAAVPVAPSAEAPAPDAEAQPARLDLATLYTMRGLFRGTPRMPIPSNLDGHLYVPAGSAGIAMANLAARMGLETTGITLPLATPATSATVAGCAHEGRGREQVRTSARKPSGSFARKTPLQPATRTGPAKANCASSTKPSAGSPPCWRAAMKPGAAAALGLLADHFPNLWEPGKQYLSLEEIRYDLHRFFSLRSSAGQASAALYRLDKWAEEIEAPTRNVEAKVYRRHRRSGLEGSGSQADSEASSA